MLQSSQLFSDVPLSFTQVIYRVFNIYKAEWKPLTGLTVLFLFTYIGVLVVTFKLLALIFLGEMPYLVAIVYEMMNGGLGMATAGGDLRNLFVAKSSRMLANGDYYDPQYEDPIGEIVAFFGVLILILLAIALVLSIVTSVFGGAFVHAIGEIYAGNTPVVKDALKRGWMRKWRVLGYHVLLGLLELAILLVTFFLPLYLDTELEETVSNPTKAEILFPIVITGICSAIVIGIILALLTAAVPAIVIENKPIIAAFKRSFELCKVNLCFIYCTVFMFWVLQYATQFILQWIFSRFPSILVIVVLIFKVLSFTIHPILSFVLYMTMRVRKEGLTQEEFGNEIGSSIPVAHAVEMKAAGGKYMPTQTVDDAEII